MSGPAEKVFKNEMDKFLAGTSNIKTKSMLIFYTRQKQRVSQSSGLLILVEKWSKTYCKEQKKSFKLIENDGVHRFYMYNRHVSNINLVKNQMEEFNIRRHPTILPNETVIGQSKGCSRPIILINFGNLISVLLSPECIVLNVYI